MMMGLFDWLRPTPETERDERRRKLRAYQRKEGEPPIYCTIMAGDLGGAGPGRERACQLFRKTGVLAYATAELNTFEKGDCEFIDFANQVSSIERPGLPVTNEGAAFGLGVAGMVLAGPVGALAGALLGGSTKDVLLTVTFKDGRKVLIQALEPDLGKIQAVVFSGGARAGRSLGRSPR